ncbi:MAG: serine hydrolase [Cyanobacteria bacterium P01_H01_bin.119]
MSDYGDRAQETGFTAPSRDPAARLSMPPVPPIAPSGNAAAQPGQPARAYGNMGHANVQITPGQGNRLGQPMSRPPQPRSMQPRSAQSQSVHSQSIRGSRQSSIQPNQPPQPYQPLHREQTPRRSNSAYSVTQGHPQPATSFDLLTPEPASDGQTGNTASYSNGAAPSQYGAPAQYRAPAPTRPPNAVLGRIGARRGAGAGYEAGSRFSAAPSQLPQTGNNVTPLRPRRHRASPSSPRPLLPQQEPRGDRRPAQQSRRTVRRHLPKPLLYTLRMLILGVGVAAIAGTLLSILNPQRTASSDPNTGAPPPSANAAPNDGFASASRPNAPSLVSGALPLGTELTHLQEKLEQLVTLTPGLEQTIFMVDLDSGAYVDIGGDQQVAAASTIKLPILVAFLQAVDRGTVRLDQSLTLNQEDLAGGSGEMENQPIGSQYSALEVASAMIITSDNTATNMIIELLGGADTLNQQFRSWGLTQTLIRNPLPDLPGTNMTSAKDLAALMARIDQGQLLEMRSRDRLMAIMQRTQSRNLIPAGVSNEALVANKTGDIATVLADVALIDLPNGNRYVLAVLTTRPENDGRARELIRRVSQEVYRELSQPVAPTGGEPPIEVPNVESEGSLIPQG